MEWIVENRTWLFSGLGGVILTAVITVVLNRRARVRASKLTNRSQTISGQGIAAQGDVNVSATSCSTAIVMSGDATFQQIRGGSSQPPPAGSPPPIPQMFVGRDTHLSDLRARLRAFLQEDNHLHAPPIVSIRGWPGVGKTTIASALCCDPEVVDLFPDGVLWASLGPDPAIHSSIAAWGRAMGTSDLLQLASVSEASVALTAALRDRKCLLVVDDLWDIAHLAAFRVGGSRCGFIVTTRSTEVALKAAARPADVVVLDVLSTKSSMQLLRCMAPEVVAVHETRCVELLQYLEGLPLSIRVAGQLLEAERNHGFDVHTLLSELTSSLRILWSQAPPDLADIDAGTIPSVAMLLSKSTDRLDSETRGRFAILGPFADHPAEFDLDALKLVWRTDAPEDSARELASRGLIESVGPGRFRMHALLLMHARSLLGD